jgi:hypothetical protein
MAEKHYVGEINTEIRVDCGIDVSLASTRKIFFKKPNGIVLEKTPTVYNNRYMRFFTVLGDLDISGEYELQTYIVLNGWTGRGQTARFVVYDTFD